MTQPETASRNGNHRAMSWAGLLVLGTVVSACADVGPIDPNAQAASVESARVGKAIFWLESGSPEPFLSGTGFSEVIGLRVRNVGFDSIVLPLDGTPGCNFWLRLYSDSARTAPAAWDPTRRDNLVCTLAIPILRVPTGSEILRPRVSIFSAAETIADTLPEGRYYPTVTIGIRGKQIELNAPPVTLTLQ